MFYDTAHQKGFEWPKGILEIIPFAKGYITVNDVLNWVHIDILSRWTRSMGVSCPKILWVEKNTDNAFNTDAYLRNIHHIRRAFHIVKAEQEHYTIQGNIPEVSHDGVMLLACTHLHEGMLCYPDGKYWLSVADTQYGDLNMESFYHRYGVAPIRYYLTQNTLTSPWIFTHESLIKAEKEWSFLCLQFNDILDFNRWDADEHRKMFTLHMNDNLNVSKVWILFHHLLTSHYYQSCVCILKVLGLWELFTAGDKACIPSFQKIIPGVTPVLSPSKGYDDGVYRIELKRS